MADNFEEMSVPVVRNRYQGFSSLELAYIYFGPHTRQASEPVPPTSKAFLADLPEAKVDSEAECPICLKDYKDENSAKCLPCRHVFHSSCILTWLDQKNTCPLCREEFPSDDVEYEEQRLAKLRAEERQENVNRLHNTMFT